MTAAQGRVDETGRARRGRGRWALAVALLGATAAACGDGGSGGEESSGDVVADSVDFQATPNFLKSATRRSSDEPFRMEVTQAMHIVGGGDEFDAEAVVMTGELDGAASEITMDMSDLLGQMPDQGGMPPDLDLTTEIVSDPQLMYIRAPMYAQMAEMAPPEALGPVADLAVLGDGWGRIDVQALGDLSLTDVQSTAGTSGGADPRILLDLVSQADSVEELGEETVDGDEVNGLGADLTLGQVLDMQGVAVDKFVQQMGGNLGLSTATDSATAEAAMQSVVDATIPFEVWVDGDGFVRRVSMDLDLRAIFAELLANSPQASQLEELSILQTAEYSDYGDEDIQVELPPPGAESATDITEAYRQLLEAGAQAAEGAQGPQGG